MTVLSDQIRARLPDGVFEDDRGRAVAPLELLEPFENNPRDPDDFDPNKSPAFADLVNSIDKVGIREPIFVYPKEGKLHMQNGHRRRMAAMVINEKRDKAYEALLDLGQLKSSDDRPPELERIPAIPIVIVDPPASKFDQEADMWLSESQRQEWPFDRMIRFFRDTYMAADDYFRDDLKKLAGRLGLPMMRAKLFVSIVTSEVLIGAAIDKSSDALPKMGREKTLRSVIRVADVVYHDRKDVALRATGRYQVDEATLEALRSLVIKKAKEYAFELKRPAGVALERIAPKLRSVDDYSDDEVVAWLTGPGTIAEEYMPTTVKGADQQRSKQKDGKDTSDLDDLLATAKRFKKLDLKSMSSERLSTLITELTHAGEIFDEVLSAARTARRTRVH